VTFTENDKHSGHPSQSINEKATTKVYDLVRSDQRVSGKKLKKKKKIIGISLESCQAILINNVEK